MTRSRGGIPVSKFSFDDCPRNILCGDWYANGVRYAPPSFGTFHSFSGGYVPLTDGRARLREGKVDDDCSPRQNVRGKFSRNARWPWLFEASASAWTTPSAVVVGPIWIPPSLFTASNINVQGGSEYLRHSTKSWCKCILVSARDPPTLSRVR